MSTLQRAIEIAVHSHRDQTTKDGQPYVLHPLTLMMRVDSEEEKIAAVLHDVVEDTETTLEDLEAEGFSKETVEVIDLLTHREDLSYDEYIGRLAENSVARNVKLADLGHNMDITRIPNPGPKDFERLQKYHRIWTKLSRL
ncbi:MAG: GTP pyrophosphokinase [Verrucomicrobiales bacterium]|nr:GTP pyrophosphokinase [Verrucomicrobiales bacterium]